MAQKKVVMISSTVQDLPEHRQQAIEACLRQDMFPRCMENMPATNAEAIAVSLEMVEKADIYVGIFGHRYGYVPRGKNLRRISITEMEYNHAVHRGIPRLIFLMDAEHPLRIVDIEVEPARMAKLQKFKERLEADRVVAYFKDATDLRAHLIESLIPFREPESTFPSVGLIPTGPKAYIAHPYTLLHDRVLVGRKEELAALSAWARNAASPSVLTLVAPGGMGKSALTWKWFNDLAPREMSPLAGRVWWSFYDESDARLENFVIRCLAYVSGQSIESIRELAPSEREDKLLAVLEKQPFLVVLDGLERLLRAFARLDAARIDDGDDEQNEEAEAIRGTVGPFADSSIHLSPTQHPLRLTTDPRSGVFLRRLAQVTRSKILVTSRLPPADLVDRSSKMPVSGTQTWELNQLSDADALDLWRSFHVTGSDEALLAIFRRFKNFPLLICALAGEVQNYRYKPGNFDHWRQANPDFEPDKNASLAEVKQHVMRHTLRGLDPAACQVLLIVAGFRTPASYGTLVALLVGAGKPFPSERNLDSTLSDLEARGLLGWDKPPNRYDLHPVVRAVTWESLDVVSKREVHESLRAHFAASPILAEAEVRQIEDLTPGIELYHALIGLEHFDEACDLIQQWHLDEALHRLSAIPLRIQLLELLFPERKIDQPPRLNGISRQVLALNDLGRTLVSSGQLKAGVDLLRRHVEAARKAGNGKFLRDGCHDLANALRLHGHLYDSEASALEALSLSRSEGDKFMEAINLHWLAMTLGTRGCLGEAVPCMQRSIELLNEVGDPFKAALMKNYMAQFALWNSEPKQAIDLAREAYAAAEDKNITRHCIRSTRLEASAALMLGNYDLADTRLHYALELARDTHFLEEEVPVLIGLAELARKRGNLRPAREFLDEAKMIAKDSPYPLFHVDVLNTECKIDMDEDRPDAFATAKAAYSLAWFDGDPFAYHWGLQLAEENLVDLKSPVPELPSCTRPALRSWREEPAE